MPRYYDPVRTHGVVDHCRSILSRSVRIGRVRISTLEAALLGWRMFKRELGVSRLLDLDHERHSSLRTPKRERLARVLVRDGVHVLEVAIRTVLDHAASKLGLLIRVVEIDDGERDTRIAEATAGQSGGKANRSGWRNHGRKDRQYTPHNIRRSEHS